MRINIEVSRSTNPREQLATIAQAVPVIGSVLSKFLPSLFPPPDPLPDAAAMLNARQFGVFQALDWLTEYELKMPTGAERGALARALIEARRYFSGD